MRSVLFGGAHREKCDALFLVQSLELRSRHFVPLPLWKKIFLRGSSLADERVVAGSAASAAKISWPKISANVSSPSQRVSLTRRQDGNVELCGEAEVRHLCAVVWLRQIPKVPLLYTSFPLKTKVFVKNVVLII